MISPAGTILAHRDVPLLRVTFNSFGAPLQELNLAEPRATLQWINALRVVLREMAEDGLRGRV
jgi:hypothetical protein